MAVAERNYKKTLKEEQTKIAGIYDQISNEQPETNLVTPIIKCEICKKQIRNIASNDSFRNSNGCLIPFQGFFLRSAIACDVAAASRTKSSMQDLLDASKASSSSYDTHDPPTSTLKDLTDLTTGTPESIKQAVERGAVKSVLDIMRQSPNEEGLHEKAYRALASLSQYDHGYSVYKSGVVKECNAMLVQRPKWIRAHLAGLDFLEVMIRASDHAREYLASPDNQFLKHAMSNMSKNHLPDVFIRTWRLISALLETVSAKQRKAVQKYLKRAGVFESLGSAMTVNDHQREVQVQGCRLMGALITQNLEVMAFAITNQQLLPLIRAMQTFPSDAHVVGHAKAALNIAIEPIRYSVFDGPFPSTPLVSTSALRHDDKSGLPSEEPSPSPRNSAESVGTRSKDLAW
eukprot:CAMPEP_0184650340 /NCGR_PEP_ID=MMETSP0308-20130426/7855_1 /TAXON_ID=38269 /ORGANISM="Gloeochaete witrockiana, Strain SAG 46.84" /LENGTH=402 /DNA_ID=CAMNT_0027083783 /DNA_START=71 /DNA_END=1276 /DNA_ORIENTATION=+